MEKPRKKPRVCIVSPAAETANNGNGQTAARWRRFLAPVADVQVVLAWRGEPVDAMIALHARRSAESVRHFRSSGNNRLALVLTGTDLYRDIDSNNDAQHALKCASEVVVLQDEGLNRLEPLIRAKARVIVQSASKGLVQAKAAGQVALVAVGHLREEKDPLVLMRAARLLPAASPITIVHLGDPLDVALADAARQTAAECSRYRWLGGVPRDVARRWISRSHALVHMSRIEGGANVVIEAVRSGVPVLASRIDGNVGLLGHDYEGYFPSGDAEALAALMQRFQAEPGFAVALAAQCALRAPLFAPQAERRSVRKLLADLLSLPASGEPATWALVGPTGKSCKSNVPGTLGGHKRSRIYGRLDCHSALRAIAKSGYVAHRVFFLDEQSARAAGYRPCARCMPAEYAQWKSS